MMLDADRHAIVDDMKFYDRMVRRYKNEWVADLTELVPDHGGQTLMPFMADIAHYGVDISDLDAIEDWLNWAHYKIADTVNELALAQVLQKYVLAYRLTQGNKPLIDYRYTRGIVYARKGLLWEWTTYRDFMEKLHLEIDAKREHICFQVDPYYSSRTLARVQNDDRKGPLGRLIRGLKFLTVSRNRERNSFANRRVRSLDELMWD